MKRAVIYGAAVLLALLLTSPVIIGWVMNSTPAKRQISSLIFEKTGHRINPESLSISIFPKTRIVLKNFQFSSDPFKNVQIKSLKLDIKALKLLSREFYIDRIVLEQPQIMNILPRLTPGEKQNTLLPENFSLKSAFSFLPAHQDAITVTVEKAVSPFFKELDADFWISKKKERISLSSTIRNVTIRFPDIFGSHSHPNIRFSDIFIKRVSVSASLDKNMDLNARLTLEKALLTGENKKPLLRSAHTQIKLTHHKNILHIAADPFLMDYPSAEIGLDFSWDRPQKKCDFQISGRDIDIGQARQSALKMLNTEVSDTLFQVLEAGVAHVIKISFSSDHPGTLLDENKLVLDGRVSHADVHIPETPLRAMGVEGNARLKNGVLHLDNLSGQIKQSNLLDGKMDIDLLNYEDFPFKGDFDLDVDISRIPEVLILLLPDTTLSSEMLKVHNVKGRCRAGLTLEVKTGEETPQVTVHTRDFSVSGEYEPIPDSIWLENIQFHYESDKVTLKNVSGTIYSNILSGLNMDIDIADDFWLNISSGSGSICLDTAIPWLKSHTGTAAFLSRLADAGGEILFGRLQLTGHALKPQNWSFTSNGRGAQIHLSTVKDKKEIENLFFSYAISNKNLKIENINFEVQGYSWLTPYVGQKILTSVALPVHVSNAYLEKNPSDIECRTTVLFDKNIEMLLLLSGRTFSDFHLNALKIMDHETTDAALNFGSDDLSFFDFKGKFNTTTLKHLLIPGSSLSNTLNELTRGQAMVLTSGRDPAAMEIKAGFINLDTIVSFLEKDSGGTRQQRLPKKQILVTADKVGYKKISFTDVRGKIVLKKNHSYIRISKASLCDIDTSGYFNLKDGMVYANFPLKADSRQNIQDLLSCLAGKKNFMDGAYSFNCELSCSSPKKEAVNNFSGPLNFDAHNGRIYKLTLLSRILSVLNVSKVFQGKIPDITQSGFAYKNIEIEADIKKSIVHLKKAVIDGQDMTMIFTGDIDPLADKINLTCLVAPFKTIDLIIEKIPIVSTLMSGRLISVPVKATGKLSDPSVIPLHPSAVGKGVIDMMANILKTPIKLLEKLSDDEK